MDAASAHEITEHDGNGDSVTVKPRVAANRREKRSWGLLHRRYRTSFGRSKALPHPWASNR